MGTDSDDRGVSGADVLLRTLESAGVRYVFTCPGTTEVPVLDASLDHPDIDLVLTLHESVAVAMADGYARASGRPGIAYLHTNVGLTNGLSHLYAAHVAGSPVVVLNGVKPLSTLGRRGFTSTPYIRDLARPYCKSDWMSLRAELIAEDLRRALHTAQARPSGPAYLALPQDLLAAAGVATTDEPSTPQASARPDPAAVNAAARLLAGSRRPALVAGGDVARSGAHEALAALATALHAPLLAQSRRDLEQTACATGHPNYCGLYDPSAAEADVVFWVGAPTPLEFEPDRAKQVPAGAALIHLCDDAAELGRVYPAAVALLGDAGTTLTAISDALAELEPGPVDDRRQALDGWRTRWLAERARLASAVDAERAAGSLGARSAVAVLREHLTPHTVVVADAVTAGQAVLDALPRHAPGDFFATASGSLGWGAGAALGVQLACPDRQVVAVLGDGVFHFGIQALWTAVRYRLPVTFLVLDNASYAAVRLGLRTFGGRAAGSGRFPLTDISGPAIADLARGYGAAGYVADDVHALDKALLAALGSGQPSVIDARTDRDR